MKRLFACLSLCLLLAACASPSLHDERADERAADAAAAQALAASAPPVSEALDPWLQAQRARIELRAPTQRSVSKPMKKPAGGALPSTPACVPRALTGAA